MGVEPGSNRNADTVEFGGGPQQNAKGPRKLHRRGAPSSFKNPEIIVSARSVAPRLSSTKARAESPIFRMRSGSRKNSIHATPASSGLSTCTAAPADTKRAAISEKFSIEGPNTGILPKAAGSRILWPPDGTREPPTNTPSAQRYREANSPMLSNSNTVTSLGISVTPE